MFLPQNLKRPPTSKRDFQRMGLQANNSKWQHWGETWKTCGSCFSQQLFLFLWLKPPAPIKFLIILGWSSTRQEMLPMPLPFFQPPPLGQPWRWIFADWPLEPVMSGKCLATFCCKYRLLTALIVRRTRPAWLQFGNTQSYPWIVSRWPLCVSWSTAKSFP